MNMNHSLEKLQEMKENEMNETQSQYNRSLEYFEQVGEQLYDVLKRKENLERQFEGMVNQRVKASSLITYSQQINNIKSQEHQLQVKVHQARLNMQTKENQLIEAHQEVKKLEKLITKKQKESRIINLRKENQFLDDLSVQQYVRTNG